MSTCWAIIIGINQYQGFQPLMQAQNDAVGIRRYLIDDVGFAPENCILLSDLSTSIEQEAVYPDRMAINDWLETICQGRVQKDDTLWFYFSGYGAQADNRDYLMPVDGDPAQIKQTGIALQDVVKFLKQTPTKNVMMVLDINRSQSALAGQAIGTQVTKLARKSGIPLILSCQPNEFSHETLAVRHGLFTAALLEGLRYDGCATLSHLERYLVERVPELCEHHWRPIQNPVVMLPEDQKFQLLWHQRDISADTESTAEVYPVVGTDSQPTDTEGMTDDVLESGGLIPDNPDGGDDGDDLIPEPIPELVLEDELPEEPQREPFSLEVDDPIDDVDDVYGTTLVEDLPDVESNRNRSGGCLPWLLLLGGLLLLAAVLFRNQPLVQSTLQERVPPEWLARVGLDGDGDSPSSDGDGTDGADGSASDEADTATTDETDVSAAETPDEATAETPDGETPEGSDTNETASSADAETPEDSDTDSDTSGTPEEAPDSEASDGATENSEDTTADTADGPSTGGATAAGNTATSGSSGSANNNTAALLEEARRSLRPSQASRFASAIATARQIPPGDPNYNQAQADIQRWSQVILDLAEGRAAETELQAAINAAKLVPREPADIYRQAQDNIQVWEARMDTRALIREAQAIPRMGQASTYQRGILELQKVPSNQPVEYADAQRLIGEWTEKMLTIARARAAQGRYNSAIEAAALIPKNTQNYQQAQTEIKRWQER
ncbi:MAG: caspase family protein [Cyanobacteria bacterium P01_B01_bin.77]